MSNLKNSWPVILGFVAIGVIIGVVLTSGLDIDSKSFAEKHTQTKICEEYIPIPVYHLFWIWHMNRYLDPA